MAIYNHLPTLLALLGLPANAQDVISNRPPISNSAINFFHGNHIRYSKHISIFIRLAAI